MARILTDIPDEDIEKLDALAARGKRSRAATIRDAVRMYLVQQDDDRGWIERGAGLWKHKADIGDAVEYQRAMRDERRPCDAI